LDLPFHILQLLTIPINIHCFGQSVSQQSIVYIRVDNYVEIIRETTNQQFSHIEITLPNIGETGNVLLPLRWTTTDQKQAQTKLSIYVVTRKLLYRLNLINTLNSHS